MSVVDDSFAQRLDAYREIAAGIEVRLGESAHSLAGTVSDAFTFLEEVESCLVNVEAEAEYASALDRSGARAVLDRLEQIREMLSAR